MDIANLGFRVDTSDLKEAKKDLNAISPAAAGAANAASKMEGVIESTSAASAKAVNQIAGAYDNLGSKVNKAASGVKPSLVVNNGPTAPARDQMPNRFNTGNIAAQFQDIGVTAAMGMNPLQIALQQGTQLSAILNSMEKPLQGLSIALKSVFNATSLLTVGFVAIIAAGLQLVNWVSVLQGVLNGLASVLDFVANNVDLLMTGLAALIGAVVAVKAAMIAWNVVILITSGALYSLIAANVAAGAAAVAAAAATSAAWVMTSIRTAAAFVLMHIAAGATIKDFIIMGAEAVASGAAAAAAWLAAVLPFTLFLGAVAAGAIALIAFREDLKNLLGFDVLDAIKDNINKVLGFFFGLFEAIWAGAKALIDKLKGKEGAQAVGDAMSEAMSKALNRDYIGMIGPGLKKAADAVRKAASGIGAEDVGKDKRTPFEQVVAGGERKLATLKAEQAAIGQTAAQTSLLKYQTELLNDAQQKNIKLTPQQREELMKLAGEMAQTEEQTRRMKEAYAFLKDTTKGFFQDMKQGLQEGKSLWESFGNAVTNVLNKILDKLLDSGIDMLFNGLFGGPTSGGSGSGGAFGNILSSIGSFLFSAKGNAFTDSGVMKFAKGGSFTNSVIDTPTFFRFGKGGALGQMGEAGPEAVMPLHRGPDGSLGVRAANNTGGTNVQVNVMNYGDSKVSTNQRQTQNGVEIDIMIDEIISQKIAEQSSATNRSLTARDNRKLISR